MESDSNIDALQLAVYMESSSNCVAITSIKHALIYLNSIFLFQKIRVRPDLNSNIIITQKLYVLIRLKCVGLEFDTAFKCS